MEAAFDRGTKIGGCNKPSDIGVVAEETHVAAAAVQNLAVMLYFEDEMFYHAFRHVNIAID